MEEEVDDDEEGNNWCLWKKWCRREKQTTNLAAWSSLREKEREKKKHKPN